MSFAKRRIEEEMENEWKEFAKDKLESFLIQIQEHEHPEQFLILLRQLIIAIEEEEFFEGD